jgi:esterase
MKLFYREFGKGEPLIILHGLFGMSDNWVTFASKFAEKLNRHVIVPDQRNHGQSPHHPVFGYHALVDDLAQLFEDLEISKAAILGHSLGGKVAMHFALDYPSSVERIVVADISPVHYKTWRHANLLEIMNNLNFSNFLTKKDVELELERHLNDKRLVNFMMKNIRNMSRDKMGWKLNIDSIRMNLDEVFAFKPTGHIFEGKVLWLKGELSDYVQQTHHLSMYSMFPETLLRIIPNASHWLHADNPDAFEKEVIDWFESE